MVKITPLQIPTTQQKKSHKQYFSPHTRDSFLQPLSAIWKTLKCAQPFVQTLVQTKCVKTLAKCVQAVFYFFIAKKNYIVPLLSLFYQPTETVFYVVFPAEQIVQWVLPRWVKCTAIQLSPISFTHLHMYFFGDFNQRSLFGTKLTAISILIY